MAKLSEFLGELVSGISAARKNSDEQSIIIANEYAIDPLLKHFAVPRMRVNTVEFNIPVAIDKLSEKTKKVYEPIDNVRFSARSYQKILESLKVTKLSLEISKKLKTDIAEYIQLLEAQIRVGQSENVLNDFCENIASKIMDEVDIIFKEEKRKKLSKDEQLKFKNSIIKGLQETLKDEIKFKSEKTILDSLQVIVEADKLREIKPENVIMIKMIVSEQGMEWIKMENAKGEVVTKLMPE